VLAVCCSALFVVSLDNTALNVALPTMRRDLHASVSGLQWAIDAYLVVLASLLLLAGSTGDRIGRRRVFRAGLALFTAASLACSLAPTLGWLIAFRAAQGVGGSMLIPVAMTILTNVFTEHRARARAIGIWSAVTHPFWATCDDQVAARSALKHAHEGEREAPAVSQEPDGAASVPRAEFALPDGQRLPMKRRRGCSPTRRLRMMRPPGGRTLVLDVLPAAMPWVHYLPPREVRRVLRRTRRRPGRVHRPGQHRRGRPAPGRVAPHRRDPRRSRAACSAHPGCRR
jgi:hypothetical protein